MATHSDTASRSRPLPVQATEPGHNGARSRHHRTQRGPGAILACLAPPTVHTTARLMTVPRLVTWADRWRTLAPADGAKAGSTLAQ